MKAPMVAPTRMAATTPVAASAINWRIETGSGRRMGGGFATAESATGAIAALRAIVAKAKPVSANGSMRPKRSWPSP